MDALNKIVTSFTQALDFNQATFSGCVDIMVVQQRDGSLKSTPFHLRLGKLKVLKSKDKEVKVHVNGFESNLKMRLGDAGEGYFIRETNISPKVYEQQELKNKIEIEVASNQARAEIDEAKRLAHHLSMKHTLSNVRTSAVTNRNKDMKIDIESPSVDDISFEVTNNKKLLIKTLRPTSEQLKALNLRLGMNTITYTINKPTRHSDYVRTHLLLA